MVVVVLVLRSAAGVSVLVSVLVDVLRSDVDVEVEGGLLGCTTTVGEAGGVCWQPASVRPIKAKATAGTNFIDS